jgi:hypothetical protein
MVHVLIPTLGFCAACALALAGCSDEGAAAVDAAAGNDATSSESDAAALPDANPCPEGQILVDELCVTPTTSGSPFLCTIPPVAACGGDLVGTWEIVDSCENNPHYNIYETSCGDEEVTHFYYHEYSGEFTFYEGGNYSTSYTPTTYSASNMALSCGGYFDCDRLGRSWGLGTCVPEGDERCECANEGEVHELETDSSTYTIAENAVTFFGDSMASPYCIEGDILYLNRVDASTYEPLKLQRAQ